MKKTTGINKQLNLIKILFDGIINNPSRIDDVLTYWMNSISANINPTMYLKKILEMMINAKVEISITVSGEICFFNNRSLSLHHDMLNESEKVIFSRIRNQPLNYFATERRIEKTKYVKETKYTDCHDFFVNDITFCPDKLCARFVSYILSVSRAGQFVGAPVPEGFVLMLNTVESAAYSAVIKHPDHKLSVTHTETALRYGIFSIITMTWNRFSQYLPPSS